MTNFKANPQAMTDKAKLEGIKKAIRKVIFYPKKNHPRRTENGYPEELIYDQFAYERMVDSYRDALRQILKDYK